MTYKPIPTKQDLNFLSGSCQYLTRDGRTATVVENHSVFFIGVVGDKRVIYGATGRANCPTDPNLDLMQATKFNDKGI